MNSFPFQNAWFLKKKMWKKNKICEKKIESVEKENLLKKRKSEEKKKICGKKLICRSYAGMHNFQNKTPFWNWWIGRKNWIIGRQKRIIVILFQTFPTKFSYFFKILPNSTKNPLKYLIYKEGKWMIFQELIHPWFWCRYIFQFVSHNIMKLLSC